MAIAEAELKKEVKAILKGANLATITARSVRQQLEKKLGVNLTSHKKLIDTLIMADVEDKVDSSEEESEEEAGKDSDSDDDGKKKKKKKPTKASPKKRKTDGGSDDDWGSNKAKRGSAAQKGAAGRGRGKKSKSAFTKSFKLSEELADVVGSDTMPRHEVVKKLWQVIKERNLQDPSNKQFAICDDQLLKIFGVKKFRTFGMMKHLKGHFLEAA